MKIEDIKTPEDILEFMNENIKYGWIDEDNKKHIKSLKGFRKHYKTMSLEDTLRLGMGTCIEQVYLMSYLLNKINIPNKMFCTRIYEDENFNDLDSDEHMHCFILYYLNNKVYQIEHPNWERIGIYEFDNEEEAIKKINDIYIEMSGGFARPVTEFFDVPVNMSFKEFNLYINGLDKSNKTTKALE